MEIFENEPVVVAAVDVVDVDGVEDAVDVVGRTCYDADALIYLEGHLEVDLVAF